MIRIAAAGDLHFDRRSSGRLSRHWSQLDGRADILLLAGDLTQVGHIEEAKALATDLATCPVPVIAVFGNHDYHLDQNDRIKETLQDAGVAVLERQAMTMHIGEVTVGIAGLKGFGGGFIGSCATDFGEPEMKTFIRHTKDQAQFLRESLSEMHTDYKIALLHYAPVPDTLFGEKKEIFPFLGSYLLGEAIDYGKADIAFHGHAHRGIERGETLGGVPVRNVAQHVIRHAFNIYTLDVEGIIGHASLAPHAEISTSPH